MFWNFITNAALYIGSIAYQQLTKPDIEYEDAEKSEDISDFPRVKEGDGITVVFGYAYIKDAEAVYYKLGDITENLQLVETNMFSDDTYQVVSYNYHCTIQDIICLSNIDSIEYIYVNNIPCRSDWDGSTSYYAWTSNDTDILIANFVAGSSGYIYTNPIGAIENTYGYCDLEFGSDTQTPNSYLEASDQQGASDIPAYRGVVQCIKKNMF